MALSSWSGEEGVEDGLVLHRRTTPGLFGKSDFNCVTGRHSHGPLFLKWVRGGLRMGSFFIVKLRLVLSGQPDFNCVTGRHPMALSSWSGGEGGLRMGLVFIVELCLVLFGEPDFNCVTGRHSHGSLLGVGKRGVEDGLVLHHRTTPGPLWTA